MRLFQEVSTTVKDYLFPVFCLACGREGQWVCESCFSLLVISPQLFCPLCHKTTMAGGVCESCIDMGHTSFLTQHVATVQYVESALIGKIIHTLKYDMAEDILGSIDTIVDRFVSAYTQYIPSVDMILPVPLHKKRFAERGFNQAFLIARILATHTDIPLFSRILIRKRDTPHQAQLDREGRLKNVVDAFSISAPDAIRGKRILLVDDVYTTGATMQTCAEVILASGASSVSGWTIARG